jgi:hypothetical protein
VIQYQQFYKAFGLRMLGSLAQPRMHPIASLSLPFNSIYHYLGEAGVPMKASDPIFQGNKAPFIPVQHVIDLAPDATLGNPRLKGGNRLQIARLFHQKNRRFRFIRDYSLSLTDQKQLVTFNYALLNSFYRYMNVPMAHYNTWRNIWQTLWENVNAVAAQAPMRQQFIVFPMPAKLPAPSVLMKYDANGMTNSMIRMGIDTHESMAIADLWQWLGENRSKSAIGAVKDEYLNHINFIFVESGHWAVLNLGALESWRKKGNEEVHLAYKQDTLFKMLNVGSGEVPAQQLQRRMLRMCMSITEARSVNDVDALEEAIEELPETEASLDEQRDEDGQLSLPSAKQFDETDVELQHPTQDVPTDAPAADLPKTDKKASRFGGVQAVDLTKIEAMSDVDDVDVPLDDEDIEADLKALEVDVEEMGEEEAFQYKPYVPPATDPAAGVTELAKRMVNIGALSAAQYRRMEQLANRYKDIHNPYGEGKLTDILTISEAEVALPEEVPIGAHVTGIADESMRYATLARFDSDYVRNVLKKDVAKMVMNIQKAGVAIQNYDVERVDELNGSYEIHTVKIVPVVGTPTTMRFQLPVVDDNGKFKAKGVHYSMRKQRGNLPIVKVSPSEVAMTSYYSKLFVSRSERAVFNYPNWLLNQLTAIGVDPQDSRVTDLRLANVFDNEAKVPRTYSIIASRISEFKTPDYHFSFNYENRFKAFGVDMVKAVESKGTLVPVGKAGEDLLVMDKANIIYRIAKGEHFKIGEIEDILKLDKRRAPIEIAEVGIFAKPIPLGLILGHEAGLGNLLKTLGLPYRREKTRSRYAMGDDEFDVRFEDETLIFKRENKLAQLIFGGFNRFHRDVKRYSIYAFDRKDTYANILDANGLGTRFIRELDLIFKMWVDHITEELLVEMKLPTDLFNLFLVAAKMLETDDHPQAIDNLYMRDKGYERFAGLMYGEMIRAVRQYKGKPANAKAAIDLNPFAVWKAITDDATVTTVEDSNPIANLSEKEVVVYRGAGGRSARAMTARHRAYHKSGIGVVSEATPDNGDTATITYLTANPNYRSLRGTIRKLDKVEGNAARVMSTSALLAPGCEVDDPKRILLVPSTGDRSRITSLIAGNSL